LGEYQRLQCTKAQKELNKLRLKSKSTSNRSEKIWAFHLRLSQAKNLIFRPQIFLKRANCMSSIMEAGIPKMARPSSRMQITLVLKWDGKWVKQGT
jgi:hypothetical protein